MSSAGQAPNQMDLLARRLQLKLAAQVADNWLALTEPQRYAILQAKDPLVQILLSFAPLVQKMAQLEANTEASLVEDQLNGLAVQPEQIRILWYRHWDKLRMYISETEQLYAYFSSFVQERDVVGF